MKITRLYTGKDEQSHFEDLVVPLSLAEIGEVSAPIAVEHIVFGKISDLKEVSWHNPPLRQYVILLESNMEIEVGSGAKRTFHPGDVLLIEDITGQGHVTRLNGPGVPKYVVIPLSLKV